MDDDEYDLLRDLDRSDLTSIEKEFSGSKVEEKVEEKASPTLVVNDAPAESAVPPVTDMQHATISDLSDGLKKMAEEPSSINDTIILK